MRESSYDVKQKFIQENEADLHMREKYRYSKKPAGFWRDRSQELEFNEEENRVDNLNQIAKRFNNTNSDWLLKGPYLGTGRYKDHVRIQHREVRKSENHRFNIFLKAQNELSKLGMSAKGWNKEEKIMLNNQSVNFATVTEKLVLSF